MDAVSVGAVTAGGELRTASVLELGGDARRYRRQPVGPAMRAALDEQDRLAQERWLRAVRSHYAGVLGEVQR